MSIWVLGGASVFGALAARASRKCNEILFVCDEMALRSFHNSNVITARLMFGAVAVGDAMIAGRDFTFL